MENSVDNKLEKRAREILQQPYSRILIPQDHGFTAEILEFPGCFAEGDTADEANANLEAAAESWIIACFDIGKPIPDPLVDYEGSGKFALRLPRSLYGRAAKAAARDGVSLNQFITHAVAEKLGAATAANRAERLWQDIYTPSIQTLIANTDFLISTVTAAVTLIHDSDSSEISAPLEPVMLPDPMARAIARSH